jgi:NADH-quinone oxidoreductase subunit C
VNITELREHLCTRYPELCPLFSIEFGDGVLTVPSEQLLEAAADLKELGFDLFGMITAVDYGEKFELVYRLRSRQIRAGLIVKTRVGREEAHIASVTDLWPGANWHEREVFDLFGIVFEGHPNLKRILLPDDWVGFPLRKDYEDEGLIRRPDYL